MTTEQNELAPTGKLRVGVNHGNFLLVQKNADGTIRGIVPDLAQELAKRLGVDAELHKYEKVGDVADGAKKGEWDVAFIGAEPQRAQEIAFTSAYVEIPATYLVPAGSTIRGIEEVDRPGVRIASSTCTGSLVRRAAPSANRFLWTSQALSAAFWLSTATTQSLSPIRVR